MKILEIEITGLTKERVAEIADEFYNQNASAENVQWRKENNLTYQGGEIEHIIYSIFDMCNQYQHDPDWSGSEEQSKFKFERFQEMFS